MSLEKLIALNPKVIVPGHGPIMHDSTYLKLMAELFQSIKRQVEISVARGDTLEQTRMSIDLKSFHQQFAGESRVRNMVFNSYVVGAGVELLSSTRRERKRHHSWVDYFFIRRLDRFVYIIGVVSVICG